MNLVRRGQTPHKELHYGFAVIYLANIQRFQRGYIMNNYPKNTKSDQTSSHRNLVRLLQHIQNWLSGKKYKLLLSQYYNMVFEN